MSQIDIGCSMMLICTTSSILGINKDVLGEVKGEGEKRLSCLVIYESPFYTLRSLRAVYGRDISIVEVECY